MKDNKSFLSTFQHKFSKRTIFCLSFQDWNTIKPSVIVKDLSNKIIVIYYNYRAVDPEDVSINIFFFFRWRGVLTNHRVLTRNYATGRIWFCCTGQLFSVGHTPFNVRLYPWQHTVYDVVAPAMRINLISAGPDQVITFTIGREKISTFWRFPLSVSYYHLQCLLLPKDVRIAFFQHKHCTI